MSFLGREENKLDADIMLLQQEESKCHLELPGVIKRAT